MYSWTTFRGSAVREGFSMDLADLFFKDLLAAVDNLNQEVGASVLSGPAGFRH